MTDPNIDLSFLDKVLGDFDADIVFREMERITEALTEAFRTLDGEAAVKDFWTDLGVDWRDAAAGQAKLGSMLHGWLIKEGIVENWDPVAGRYDPVPEKTRGFMTSTRTTLQLAFVLGAILATKGVDTR